MSFRETLARHLEAIRNRDLEALAATLAEDALASFETPQLALAVLRLEYREPPATRSESWLTLVFERRGERWVMVQDQNTPIRQP